MNTETTIALDCMGGDFGIPVVVPAALRSLAQHPELNVILVGQRDEIEAELAKHKEATGTRLHIQHASEVVGSDEPPSQALRGKKDSSMRVAINLVKEGRAQACVSAGNTGALMATARFVLKTLPGIDRPAICTILPNIKGGHTHVLDLGANVDSSAESLLEFAVMGSALCNAVDNTPEPSVGLLNIGEEEIKGNEPKHKEVTGARLHIQHASEVVGSDEPPSQALRGKKDSSMRVAINLVKEGRAQACVSAGNTGALMATARFVLKTLPGIDRPAICTVLPNIKGGHTHVLDLGANVDSSAESLLEFAVMGSALCNAVDNTPKPSVGLLNIGEEEIKGNERVKEAARLLADSQLNYVGYVEGDGIYIGDADVVVCDGFVGNVMLKTTEGVAKMISHYMKQEFKRNVLTLLSGLIALPVLKAFRKRIDPREYNGASLLGLQGIVIKSHGSADTLSFSNAIREAIMEVKNNVPARITKQLEYELVERQAS